MVWVRAVSAEIVGKRKTNSAPSACSHQTTLLLTLVPAPRYPSTSLLRPAGTRVPGYLGACG
eukprot:2864335-Rhodomonas_salina.1